MKLIDFIPMNFLSLDEVWIYLSNPIFNLAAAALLTFYASRRERLMEISYFIENELIIGDIESQENSAIKIFYDEVEVPRLEKMRLVIWNSGNNCIDSTDVVQPLRFKGTSEFKFLQVKCLKKSKDAIKIISNDLSRNKEIKEFHLNFNYLDPNDGFVFEFTHTGNMNFGSVDGEVKKMGRVKRVAMDSNNWRYFFSLHFISVMFVSLLGIFLYKYLSPGLLGTALFFGVYYGYFHFFVFGSALPVIPKSLKVDELRNVRYQRIGSFL
jgi:hypothetical protein